MINPRQRSTLPPTCAGSTIGGSRLNFRVRNGNGCDPAPMATGKLLENSDLRFMISDCGFLLQSEICLLRSPGSTYLVSGVRVGGRGMCRVTHLLDRPRAFRCQKPASLELLSGWSFDLNCRSVDLLITDGAHSAPGRSLDQPISRSNQTFIRSRGQSMHVSLNIPQ